jgi:hypothetical protein
MTRTTAEKVIQLLLDAGAALNETVRIIQEEAQPELTEYCQRTGQTMAAIYLDLIKPIARVYPDLDPAREGS